MTRFALLILSLTLSQGFLRAQAPGTAGEIWDLTRCLDYALEHSLDVALGDVAIRQADINVRQSKLAQLPNVSASASYGLGFGRNTTPDNQTIDASRSQNNTFGINGGMTLFSGFAVRNNIRLNQSSRELANMDRSAAEDLVKLNVATAYVGVLLAMEDEKRLQSQLLVSQENLANSVRLAEAGVIPEGNLRDLEAQLANDELGLIQTENGVKLAYLGLRLTMQTEAGLAFIVRPPSDERMAAELVKEDWDANVIFQRASGTLAAITSNDLAESIAAQNIILARSAFWPTLSLGGGANTSWFSSSELAAFLPSYGTQLDNNLAESVGLSLSIPLFSNGNNQAAVQSAELGLRQQEIFNEQELNQLRQTVQQAVADADAAAGSFTASLKVVEARRLATEFAQKRFDAGQATAFEFNNARNLLQQAEANLLRAKYTFLLARKTIDFYMGKELSF